MNFYCWLSLKTWKWFFIVINETLLNGTLDEMPIETHFDDDSIEVNESEKDLEEIQKSSWNGINFSNIYWYYRKFIFDKDW